ncbi:MAG: sugar transferase [Deltaproteobacteria bacterium]|nr:sugar transferase [Deltaproteobacteria bacterium]
MGIYNKNAYDDFKSALDLVCAVVILIITSPLLLLVSMLMLIFYGRPIIYRQARLTAHGKVFYILKLRTMIRDAEAQTGAVWAADGDPRITPFGRLLRYTRMDELPQLINVIRGEMSLIGPRPERPEIAEEIQKTIPSFKKRLAVKAGITGLAQVQTGYAANIEGCRKKLAFDLLYIKHRSLWLDFLIALRTAGIIITGSGSK